VHAAVRGLAQQAEAGRVLSLSSEDLHDPIAPCADDPSPILAPDHGAHTLTPHQTMAGDLLGAASRFKTPEPEACVVPG